MTRFSAWLAHKTPFFYGYVVAAVAVLVQICSSPGQTFAISAFTPYLMDSLQLSSSQLAAAYMLGTLLAAMPLSLIGPLSDRWGIRWTLVGVALGLSLACFFISAASGFLSLLIGFLLLRFLGQGALTLLGSNLVSMWFHSRLGSVNACMSVGGAAAFALVPLILLESIGELGWRTTYLCMGGIVACTLIPASLVLVRNRPEDLGLVPDGRLAGGPGKALEDVLQEDATKGEMPAGVEKSVTFADAVRHRAFWILAADMCLWAMIGTGIVFYALPIYESYGIPADKSKLLFTTFSASMLLAQVTGGILADRLAMRRLLCLGFCLMASGACVIPFTSQEWHVHAFALLFGLGQGLAIAVSTTMWVRYYGRPNLGKIRGAVWCMTVAGSGCGPLLLGLTYDLTGSFHWGLVGFAAALLPLGPLSLWATAPSTDLPTSASGELVQPQALDRLSASHAHQQEDFVTRSSPAAKLDR